MRGRLTRINAVCHSVVIRRRISRSISASFAWVRAFSGRERISCLRYISSVMCFCASNTVRRRVSVGCAVRTGATCARSNTSAISEAAMCASVSLLQVASNVESIGGSPASSLASSSASSLRSSARLASNAKWLKARMIGIVFAGSMLRKSSTKPEKS